MPGWITVALERPSLDLSSGPRYSIERTRTLLDGFDRNVREARAAIARTGDESLREPRSLTLGERVLFTSTRGETVRQNISHLVHHRGQLTVYLRLLDVPIPSIYGPTADEGWSG